MVPYFLGSGGLHFIMNCTNVSVHATNLTLHVSVHATNLTLHVSVHATNLTLYVSVHATNLTLHVSVHATNLTLYVSVHATNLTLHVSVHATNLTLYGNEGYFGGNMCLDFLLFTNISVTLKSSSLTAVRGSKGRRCTCYYRSRRELSMTTTHVVTTQFSMRNIINFYTSRM